MNPLKLHIKEHRLERADGSLAALRKDRGQRDGYIIETVSDYPPPLGLQCGRYISKRHNWTNDFAWARNLKDTIIDGHLTEPMLSPDEQARWEVAQVKDMLDSLPFEVVGEVRVYRPSPAMLNDIKSYLLNLHVTS
jgi:hypothetical protein